MTPASRNDGTVHSSQEGRSLSLCSCFAGRAARGDTRCLGVAQVTDQTMAQFSLYRFCELYRFSYCQVRTSAPACHFRLQALVLKNPREKKPVGHCQAKPTFTLEKAWGDEKTAWTDGIAVPTDWQAFRKSCHIPD